MKLAILGATSEIAKDLILSFADEGIHELTFFARRPEEVIRWLSAVNLSNRYLTYGFESFHHVTDLDAVLNFVGAGDPAKVTEIGSSILEITEKYDRLVLEYLKGNPKCRYIFISSGAVYGENFVEPVSNNMPKTLPFKPNNHYAAAKIQAEIRHRNLTNHNIIDLRIFSYFSHTQSLRSRFFMADVMRAIKNKEVLLTSAQNMVRDYLSSTDFHQLVKKALLVSNTNLAVDCYSKAPVDKFKILSKLKDVYGLRYDLLDESTGIGVTGDKQNYYSLNYLAQQFGYVPTKDSLTSILTEAEIICSV